MWPFRTRSEPLRLSLPPRAQRAVGRVASVASRVGSLRLFAPPAKPEHKRPPPLTPPHHSLGEWGEGNRNICGRSYGNGARRVQMLALAAAVAAVTLVAAVAQPGGGGRPVKIVALGDSLTAGLGLPADATFPVRLQRPLSAREASPAEKAQTTRTSHPAIGRRFQSQIAITRESVFSISCTTIP